MFSSTSITIMNKSFQAAFQWTRYPFTPWCWYVRWWYVSSGAHWQKRGCQLRQQPLCYGASWADATTLDTCCWTIYTHSFWVYAVKTGSMTFTHGDHSVSSFPRRPLSDAHSVLQHPADYSSHANASPCWFLLSTHAVFVCVGVFAQM